MRLGGCGLLAAVLGPLGTVGCTVFDGVVATEEPVTSGSDAGTDAPATSQQDGSRPGMDSSPGPASCVDSARAGANSYLTVQDAAKVCALVQSCNGDSTLVQSLAASVGVATGAGDFSSCMQWMAGAIAPSRVGMAQQKTILQCLVGKTCSDWGSCVPFEALKGGDPRCAAAGKNPTCADPSTVLDCPGGFLQHCTSSTFGTGASCRVGGLGGECALSTCVCNSTQCSPNPVCAGPGANVIELCEVSNLDIAFDCATAGHLCADNVMMNFLYCASDGTTEKMCGAGGNSTCAGNTLMVCDGNYSTIGTGPIFSEFDCTAVGGTCSTDGGYAHCVRPTDTCHSYDPGMNTCVGSSLTVCIDGAPGCVDCASLGMKCVPNPNGPSACAP